MILKPPLLRGVPNLRTFLRHIGDAVSLATPLALTAVGFAVLEMDRVAIGRVGRRGQGALRYQNDDLLTHRCRL